MAQYTCEGAAVPEALTSSCNGVVVYPTAARYTNLSQGYAWDTPAAREAEATVGIEYLATAQTVGNRDCRRHQGLRLHGSVPVLPLSERRRVLSSGMPRHV